MRKIFISLLLAILVCSPVFAGNLLQQEFETNFTKSEILNNPKMNNSTKETLFQNDYYSFLNNGASLYGYLLYAKNEYKTLPNTNLNKRCINIMLSQYELKIKSNSPNLIKMQKLILDDNDYRALNDDLKVFIATYNLLAE